MIKKFLAKRKARLEEKKKQAHRDLIIAKALAGDYGMVVSDDNFRPRIDGGREVDDVNKEVIEVIPTYYEYDDDGVPTGEHK